MIKKILSVCESYEERGVRDGTGPYKYSRQRKFFGKGKRRMSGKKCPFEEKSGDVRNA